MLWFVTKNLISKWDSVYLFNGSYEFISDHETIMMRQGVVSELTEKEDIFYNLQSVIDRFLDINHLLSLCVQIPKQETVKTAESKISSIIYLKHVLGLIEPLREALRDFENPLMKAYYKVVYFI